MCLRACSTRTVIFHEILTPYHHKVTFYLSNEGLFEMMALTEALKVNVKVDWSPLHVSQIAILLNLCSITVTGAFSRNIHVSIDTFSHEQLYSAHNEVSKPVVKHFQHQYHCWYQEDNVR